MCENSITSHVWTLAILEWFAQLETSLNVSLLLKPVPRSLPNTVFGFGVTQIRGMQALGSLSSLTLKLYM